MKTIHAVPAVLVAATIILSLFMIFETSCAKAQEQRATTSQDLDKAKRAVEKNPNDAGAHLDLGVAYSSVEDLEAAYREFMLAAKLDSKKLRDAENAIASNFLAHYNTGRDALQAGDAVGASTEFAKATTADPRQTKGWLNLAKTYYVVAEKDSTYWTRTYAANDSLIKYNKDTEDPNYVSSLAFEGRVLAKQGKFAPAQKKFEELLELDPSQFKIPEDAAMEYLAKQNWAAGAELLELVLTAQVDQKMEAIGTYYNLGVAYLNLKNYPKAIDAYQSAVEIDPMNKGCLYYLMLANYQGKKYDDAIVTGEKYTRKYPDDARAWHVLGLAYGAKGMTLKAQETEKKAASLVK
jgi:tetratricopeptide (TPR) repeat protein